MAVGERGSAAAQQPLARSAEVAPRVDAELRAPRVDELAWMAVLPCALVVVAAIALFGPPLGKVLFPPSHTTFWPWVVEVYEPPVPEPTEHARFLLALTAPLLLTGAVLWGRRRIAPLHPSTIAGLVIGTQIATALFLVVCFVVQRSYLFNLEGVDSGRTVYFTPATLAVAAALALAIGLAAASERVSGVGARLFAERRGRRIVGTGVAVAATAIWLLPAVNFEGTIGAAHTLVVEHLQYWLDEVFAVLDQRYPLVDFAAQYGSLWPYAVGGAMALFGASIGVFTIGMALITAAAMLAVFATLRRVVRSTVAALLLFLPVLATSFFMMEGPLASRYAVNNIFSSFPLRYAGPLLLLWLVARQLDGARPRRRWLFLAAGLVVLNNGDFGFPALGATVAALLWADGRPTRRSLQRLALEAAIGCAAAYALVSVLTLAVAGTMPHLGLLFRYSRLFALAGFRMIPMSPTIGVSTVIYLTYVAAIGVGSVRAVRGDADRLLTGLLVWSGIFGLGIGSYYMGRSHPQVLTNMFAAWALSLTLLVVHALRSIAARAPRRPTIAEAACLFGFGILVCSLAQTPSPWSEVERLQRTSDPIYRRPTGEPFIRQHIRPGEAVAIFPTLGHRTAYDLGVIDVTPYTGTPSMPTIDQFDETLRALRDAGGRKVFISAPNEWPGTVEALLERGFRPRATERYGMAEYVRQR